MDILPVLEGGCIYLPGFLCPSTDYTLLKDLTADLQNYGHDASGSSFINWSQHLKFENPSFSPTFQSILARLEAYFNVEILATRLNFYRDGSDWKPFHHDSHAYGHGGKKEDFTMGASFGSMRELAFRHEGSGLQFNFPQGNGDIFAFDSDVSSYCVCVYMCVYVCLCIYMSTTSPFSLTLTHSLSLSHTHTHTFSQVNKAFKHGVPKCKGNPANVGSRFSIIAWGRRRSLNEKNSSVSMREADQGQREWEERERGGGYSHTHGGGGGGGKKTQAHTKKGVEEEEEKEEKVSPIGMEEVVALVEKMVMKEEEKQRSKVLSSSSSSSNKHTHAQNKENSTNKKAPTKGKGGGGGEEKGDTGASATDGGVGVEAEERGKKKGRTRRGGRVQHSWACS
jgi:hypothetical protein